MYMTLSHIVDSIVEIMLFLSLPLSFIFRHRARRQQARVTAIRVKGIRTRGIINARYTGRFHWYLAFSYADQGREYMRRQSISRTAYDKIREGAAVDVAYIPENPQEAVLVDIDMWPFARSLAMIFILLSIAFIISVIGGGFLLLMLQFGRPW
ncbi:MAG: DUF3592 domain-containing protein [Ktedonobacteraceae bacterium]|nr:DUF3592 domain-containing protein [Ktedonobacteraceae bacterium]